ALFKTSLNSPVILLKIYYEKHGTSSILKSTKKKKILSGASLPNCARLFASRSLKLKPPWFVGLQRKDQALRPFKAASPPHRLFHMLLTSPLHTLVVVSDRLITGRGGSKSPTLAREKEDEVVDDDNSDEEEDVDDDSDEDEACCS
ncbi:hypothetical protein MKW94_026120, partial [Papaver nudicaule]|nr:hypothetical protein [Papaver nudicaule]